MAATKKSKREAEPAVDPVGSPEEPAADEPASATTPSTKKRTADLAEIEVDLALPEPPSKKAKRALKKGKPLPPSKNSDNEAEAESDGDGKGASASKKKERSAHGVWIGNLPFSATKATLRKWLVDSSGGSIAEEAITRVHMPAASSGRRAAPGPGGDPARKAENKGFAYVDFASFETNVAAIALSESEFDGRKLLIKDARSFEGRPKPAPAVAAAGGDDDDGEAEGGRGGEQEPQSVAARKAAAAAARESSKIFVGNLPFSATEDMLWSHFDKCGPINWVKVATFEDTGKCKGYAWVKFAQPDAAAWAVKGFVKIREAVDTLDDFAKEAGVAVAGAAPGGKKEKKKKSAEEDGDDADNDDEGGEGKAEDGEEKKPQAAVKTKNRKWWVNKIQGRDLKIELAEDDELRYKKRFGKDAQKKDVPTRSSRPARPRPVEGEQEEERRPHAADTAAKTPGKPKFADDINVARLTGAAVQPQGTKITF